MLEHEHWECLLWNPHFFCIYDNAGLNMPFNISPCSRLALVCASGPPGPTPSTPKQWKLDVHVMISARLPIANFKKQYRDHNKKTRACQSMEKGQWHAKWQCGCREFHKLWLAPSPDYEWDPAPPKSPVPRAVPGAWARDSSVSRLLGLELLEQLSTLHTRDSCAASAQRLPVLLSCRLTEPAAHWAHNEQQASC